MNITSAKSYKVAYIVGLSLNLISICIYLFTRNQDARGDFFSQSFFINYGITIAYLIFLLAFKLRFSVPRPKISYGCWINVVVLFTISAFSLNKELSVFATFPVWLNIYTLLMVALFFIYPFINNLPLFLRTTIYILSGSALLLALYTTFYLLALVPLSIIACVFFGISIHTFVPILWLWVIIDFFIRKGESSKFKHLLWVGFAIPLIVLGIYLKKWNDVQTQIKDILAEKNMQLENQLPEAIQLAQKLPSDAFTEQILVTPFKSQRFWDDGFGFSREGINKFHDPLSVIAIALFGTLDLDQNTVETLLNIRKDYRHKTSRKLWTGISLSTSSVSNNIRIFPEYRLAYHEKTIVIHNDPNKNDRDIWFVNNTQEALYTFHVPEGSIVTSLSLWINGKEQKSRLSTSQKADSAYTTIVGVERRDPAIVHWQEGNTITVNIFPCTKEEDRTFKIGFTCPLSLKDGHMWLENIWFEGPDFNSAREATSISVEGEKVSFIDLPDYLQKNAKGDYIYKGDYLPDWKIAMNPIPLSKNTFSFNGYDYSLKELSVLQKVINIKQIFLDVTKEWNKDEYDKIIQSIGNKPLYTWLPEKVQITNENKEMVWEAVKNNQFSIPFLYDIANPDNNLVITKTGSTSPLLSDLKGSDYAEKTINYLIHSNSKIAVVNIGNELSPLWRSLHELRLIDYSVGNIDDAMRIINTGKFNYVNEDTSIVSMNDSYMSIIKEKSDTTKAAGKAPDHLLRMFAYNDVLRKIGKKYFEKEKYENELFREAEEGYVVTPITSMIVLESKEDYDKMGIDENKNTVGNAGLVSGGAVPEPHEWLLIGLVFILISRHLYLKRKELIGNYFRK